MTVRRLALEQPASFAFTPANRAWCEAQIAKYPPGRQASAVVPLLWQAQAQNGYWLPKPAIEAVADMLGMPYIRVLEIATFYSMFNLEPVGKYFVQLCGTTPCMLRGSNAIKAACQAHIGEERRVTKDGLFAWAEVECLGACCNAPMVQVNDDYYEDLDAASFGKLLDDLAAGRPVKNGSQTGRVSSEQMPGPVTTLMEASLFDGSAVGAWKARFEERAKAAAAAKTAAASVTLATGPVVLLTAPTVPAAAATAAPPTQASATSRGAPVVKPSEGAGAGSAGAAASAPIDLKPMSPAPAGIAATIGQPIAAIVSGIVGGVASAVTETYAQVSQVVRAALQGSSAVDTSAGDSTALEPSAALPPMILAALRRPSPKSEPGAPIATEALASLPADATPEQKADAVGLRPSGLQGARTGKADDLKRIKGIGRVNEDKLNKLGIFHFDQIAAWTRAEVHWVGTYLAFPGRIDREHWQTQAAMLAKGGDTEFSRRVDKGEVATSAGGPSRPDKLK